ncbi:MAG: SOS response-associated peptidase [Bacteroidales bacterium]|nr:SOS response-associated peptidase [Bacteroidales bacterium]MCB9013857.1 SOS response-associated peptidase [Bacteroidales bacterium]
MCYFVEHNIQRKELEKRFNVKFPEDPRYTPAFFNSAFTRPYMPAIASDQPDRIQLFQWGLIPHWTRDEKEAAKISLTTGNARSESVWEKPSYKKAAQSGRCLISAHGFFEYQTTGKIKTPYYIRLKNDEIFAFAGIYDTWTNPQTGEIFRTFSILTTAANPLMEKIHNLKKRMPVILNRDAEKLWISIGIGKELLSDIIVPYPEKEMEAYTVSRKISQKNPDIFDPSLIEKNDYLQNGSLF